jgi:hypothetical protein
MTINEQMELNKKIDEQIELNGETDRNIKLDWIDMKYPSNDIFLVYGMICMVIVIIIGLLYQ